MDYQDPNETAKCSICGDFGWVRKDVSVNHPDFGKAFRCDCRNRFEDPSRMERMRRYSNMGYLAQIRFENTNTDGRLPEKPNIQLFKQALAVALQYTEHSTGWIVFTGPSGSGKTHLAAAISNRLLDEGKSILFVFVPDLLDHLRSTYSPNSEFSYDEFFDQVKAAPCLVLDDLGVHNSTSWAHEKLYQILNYRYVNKLPTIITLALAVEELDPRWQTRLTDLELVRQVSLGENVGHGPTSEWGKVGTELLKRMTFASFNREGNQAGPMQMQSLEVAFQIAFNFAEDPDGWLVFIGPNGCGKTHLAVAVANERLKRYQDVRYFMVSDLLDQLREAFNPDSVFSYYRLFEQVRNADLLILRDFDFDLQHVTQWAREKLNQLLIHRYDARLPTLITTVELDENQKSDPIMSRLQDITMVSIVPIDAPDYRVGNKRSV
jgi:DNA replication protein DnaC